MHRKLCQHRPLVDTSRESLRVRTVTLPIDKISNEALSKYHSAEFPSKPTSPPSSPSNSSSTSAPTSPRPLCQPPECTIILPNATHPPPDPILAGVGQRFADLENRRCADGFSGTRSETVRRLPVSSCSSRQSRQKRKRRDILSSVDPNDGGGDDDPDDDDDDGDEDEDDERDGKRSRVLEGCGAGKLDRRMACPFYRSNPLKDGDCGKYIMKNARRVKQHILRVHRPPDLHCPICGEVWSRGERGLMNRHLRERSCKGRKVSFDGITDVQREALSRLKSARGAAESAADQQQWFSMWDILFPGTPKPNEDLMYMAGTVAEAVFVVQSAIKAYGESLLSEIFPDGPALRNTIRDAMPAVFEKLQCRHITPTRESRSRNTLKSHHVVTFSEPLNKRSKDPLSTISSGRSLPSSALARWSTHPPFTQASAEETNTICQPSAALIPNLHQGNSLSMPNSTCPLQLVNGVGAADLYGLAEYQFPLTDDAVWNTYPYPPLLEACEQEEPSDSMVTTCNSLLTRSGAERTECDFTVPYEPRTNSAYDGGDSRHAYELDELFQM